MASDAAIAPWSVSDFCPSTWMAVPPLQPHVPAAVWLAFWDVPARLPATAPEPTVLDWLTEPPLPGLSTRTGEASFDAPSCAAADAARAPCAVDASCDAIWIALPEPADCDPCCDVTAPFSAAALEPAVFSCRVEPPFPPLPTRTGDASFDGSA